MGAYSKKEQLARVKKQKTSKRNGIDRKEYNLMIQNFGKECYFCKAQGTDAHHVKFRSQGGRGTWRNLRLLCKKCHNYIHQNELMRKRLENEHIELFGRFYYMDQLDLYEQGLIEEPYKDLLDDYFKKGVKK